ncbi:MAG TPA: fibronectin type III domain-containing protein, partial [Solirubrobacteraceae bacterium]|nr:fibronectin type III domain-containing protein [Solirubrobacteraceae bacterium]
LLPRLTVGRPDSDFSRAGVFRPAMRTFASLVACAGALLALLAPAALAAGEPMVATGTATAITTTSATVSGTVNPEGQSTTYYFEYGTTTSYGTQTSMAGAGSGSADVKVSTAIEPLTPNTTYHYRVVATNASGTTLGGDVSFKTPKPPAPVVVVRHATSVTQTSAILNGTVNPAGQATGYVFEYGTTTAYGAQTPTASAGSGTKATVVSATIGALAPNTTYHFRLAATSVNGTTFSHDSSFKTVAVPAGVTLGAVPATITFGELTSLGGRVLPPRPSHVTVTLQSATGPSGPWIDVANTTAASSGAYSFARLAPSSNTYYRALADGATSATVRVSVRFRVGLVVGHRHPRRGSRVRFHGHVGPRHNGASALIQWLGPHGRWHTIRRARLRGARGGLSFYSVRVPILRSGRYRVIVVPDPSHEAGRSRTVRLRVH